jgi:hypothetical protein
MTDSKIREAFEAEFSGLPKGLSEDGTLYMNLTTRATWNGWRSAYQAARQSALEEAVLACESIARNWVDTGATPADCADAIRQLAAQADKRPEGEKT